MKRWEALFVFSAGALGYGALEMLWRGRTHWSMLLLGGVCFVWIYWISNRLHCALWKRWLLCGGAITVLEFLCGCLVNLRLGWAVWDYSGERWNLLGQICPRFALFWLLLSVPCCALARLIRKAMFSEKR
jgi:uncharacterized membrane protein